MLSLRFAYDYTPFYFMEHIYNEVIKNYDDGKRRLLGFFSNIPSPVCRISRKWRPDFSFKCVCLQTMEMYTYIFESTTYRYVTITVSYFMLMKWNFHFTCYRTCRTYGIQYSVTLESLKQTRKTSFQMKTHCLITWCRARLPMN